MPQPSRRMMRSQGSRGVFWLCLIASAGLHLLLVAELPGFALDPRTPPVPLVAEIVTYEPPAPPPLPKPPPAAPRPPPKQAVAQPKPAAPEPAVAEPPPPQPIVTAEAPVEDTVAYSAEEPVAEPAEPAPATAPVQADSAPAPTPAEPAAASAEAAAERPQPPQVGTIRYEVYYGGDRFSIGRSVQTWSIDKDSYRLTSFSETTGLLGLVKPYHFAYVAEGRVEPGRLRPESFTVRRGREGERQATALFDWQHGELTFGTLGKPRKAAIDATSYDLLTLFYQLPRMELSPGSLQVAVTTGTKFDRYVLRVEPEELIELPIGTVRAIPVKQVRTPGKESIELWLAPEQRFLPVRIRFFDDDGDMTVEQVATQIAVGTLAADGR